MDCPDLERWSSDARWRLKKLGIRLRPAWEREVEVIGKRNARHYLESCRLWVAATMNALELGDLTESAREAVILLWQVAGEILDPLPRHQMEVEDSQHGSETGPGRVVCRRSGSTPPCPTGRRVNTSSKSTRPTR